MMPDLREFLLELDRFTKSWIVDGSSFDTFTLDLVCSSSIVHQGGNQLHYDGMKKMLR